MYTNQLQTQQLSSRLNAQKIITTSILSFYNLFCSIFKDHNAKTAGITLYLLHSIEKLIRQNHLKHINSCFLNAKSGPTKNITKTVMLLC